MIFFKLWVFEFDITSLFVLLIGIVTGIAIASLLYLLFVLSSIRKERYIVRSKGNVTDEEVLEIITNAETAFKDKKLQGDVSTLAHCRNINVALVNDIARRFFPDSKRPLFELSIDEVLMLARYISERIDAIIDRPALRIFKKVKISTIVGLGDIKKSIDESALMKATKKYKVKELFSVVKGAINIVNPIYWVRKLVVNKTLSYAISRICIMSIGIVGEETYKIYSKSVFDIDTNLDTGVDKLAKSLDKEFESLNEELSKEEN